MVMCAKKDFMLRGVFKEHAVRFAFGNFGQLVETGILKHDTDPLSARLLGQALISGALATVLLDEKEKYAVRFEYDGPAKGILLDISAAGAVRGFIRHPHLMTETGDPDEACGEECVISVTKSVEGKVLNSGQIKSAFISPETVLSCFFSLSDQIETEIGSALFFCADPGAPVECACGMMLQALPDCDLAYFTKLREKLISPEAWPFLSAIDLAPEKQLADLAAFLCGTSSVQLETAWGITPRFECPCSPQKLWQTARTMLGEEDFRKLLSENPSPTIRCQFCNTEHRYFPELLEK